MGLFNFVLFCFVFFFSLGGGTEDERVAMGEMGSQCDLGELYEILSKIIKSIMLGKYLTHFTDDKCYQKSLVLSYTQK